MKTNIVVPSVGESISKGVLTGWLKRSGERVEEGADLYELETEKAVLTIPAPASGVLSIETPEGAEVAIGQVVGTVETAAAATPEPAPATPPAPIPPAPAGAKTVPAPPAPSPAPAPPLAPAPIPPAPVPATAPEEPAGADRRPKRVPLSPIRRRIAARLAEARRVAAHLTTFNEIDMEKVTEIRERYREQFEKEHGLKIGITSFFVKAACQALKEFPAVSSQIEGDEQLFFPRHDIGVAVAIPEGLVVPVIRDADRLGFAGIEAAIEDLALRARERRLKPDELSGGTFTITNGGVFGSLLSTPIPNHPQSAILGLHAIQRRPVAREAEGAERVVVRPMMYAALTYDHRAIDGREAVLFLRRIKEFIEEPDKLLLET